LNKDSLKRAAECPVSAGHSAAGARISHRVAGGLAVKKFLGRQLCEKSGLWISARPLAPREIDFEPWFLFATTSFGIGCLSWLALRLPWPVCLFRHTFGVPCPTCGATRSALALAHGDIGLAFRTNPLMCLVYLGVLIFDLYAIAVLVFRMKRLRLHPIPLKVQRVLRVITVGLVVGNWIYLLCYLR
jgi:hypothetical protein